MGEGAGGIPHYCSCGCFLPCNRFNPAASCLLSPFYLPYVAVSSPCRLSQVALIITLGSVSGSFGARNFPGGKGIPKCPPEISINSHAISNLRWLFFDIGAARSTMFSRTKRRIVHRQSSFEKVLSTCNFFFCRVLKVNVLLSVNIKREIVHMQSRFEKVSNNIFLLSNTKS